MRNFKKTAAAAITSSSFSILFTIIANLIIVKYLIKWLGVPVYGMYAIATTLIGVSTVFDVGMGNSVVKFVAEFKKKDREELNKYLSTSFFLIMGFSLVVFAVICFVSTLPIYGFLGISGEFVPLAQKLFLAAAFIFLSTMLYSFFKSVLQAYLMYPLLSVVDSVKIVMLAVIGFCAVYSGGGIMGFMMAILALNLLSALVLWRYFSKKLGLYLKTGYFSIAVLSTMFSYSIYIFLNNLFSMAYLKFDKLIASHFVGVGELAYYQVPFTVASLIMGVNSGLLHFIFPSVSAIDTGSRRKLSLTFMSSVRIATILSFVLSCGALLAGGLYMKFMLGPDFYEKARIVLLLLVMVFYFSGVGIVPYFFYNGLKMPKVNLYNTIAGSVLYLFAAVGLTRCYGIVGTAAALFFGLLPFPVYFWIICKRTNNSFSGVVSIVFCGFLGVVLSAYLISRFMLVVG